MVLEFPQDETLERLFVRKPFLSRGPYPVVIRHEDSTLLRNVSEESVVVCSLWQDVYRPLNVPTTLEQSVHELLANVVVGEKWKSRH